MSQLHLSTGSKIPEIKNDGKVRLYSMRFCPWAQRAHLILDAKEIPYHTININLKFKPEWLTQKSPLGKVPALEIPNVKGDPLIESMIICEYLEEKYPQNPLRSKDPLERAREKILIERFCGLTSTFYTLLKKEGTSEDISYGIKELDKYYDILENELEIRGTKFVGGSKPGFVDLMIWPWCERIPVFKFTLGDDYEPFDKVRFSKVIEWYYAMKEDPAVQTSLISGENHYKFVQSMLHGDPDYDMLA